MLYARQPIAGSTEAPSPVAEPHRAERAPALAPAARRVGRVRHVTGRTARSCRRPSTTRSRRPPTRRTRPRCRPGDYDVAVFENLFPDAHRRRRTSRRRSIVATRPAQGACEVVVFTQDRAASLGALPLAHLELLLEVWADRYRELGARDDVEYVFPFENRGVEVGVTLHHPHGQIYAYPFVPPIPARELEQQRAYLDAHGRGLLEAIDRGRSRATARRVLYDGPQARGVRAGLRALLRTRSGSRRAGRVPSVADARRRRARRLRARAEDGAAEVRRPVAAAVSVHHGRSTRRRPTASRIPEAHLHIEFYPAYRMPGRLKYLAGSEIGAGVFTADTLPEEKAAELQRGAR